MNDTQKIQMLTDALRDSSSSLATAAGQFDFTVSAITRGQTVSLSSLQNCAANARTATAEAETVLAMVEDDGAAEMLASLPELTPALRAAGAIVAKYGLGEGLSISQACGRVHEIAAIFEALSTREASSDAR